MPDTDNFLEVDRQGAVFRIVMQRIAKKNALNTAMYNDLIASFQTAETDCKIRVILLTAAGETFTSGNDLDDFSKFRTTGKPRPGTAFISAIARLRKPIVAAVNGPAIGIGSTMLLHCDLVYASQSASFQMPFVKLGLCPEAGSTWLLPRMLGHPRASELLLLGEPIPAKKAAAIGLINRVYPDDQLAAGAMAAAQKIASQPPEAILATKALIKANDRQGLYAAIAREGRRFDERLASLEFEKGYTAFKARRPG